MYVIGESDSDEDDDNEEEYENVPSTSSSSQVPAATKKKMVEYWENASGSTYIISYTLFIISTILL